MRIMWAHYNGIKCQMCGSVATTELKQIIWNVDIN